MFGYIKPDIPELKVKENEAYKAYYCGLCHSIKKHLGNLPRFSLTYDFAFLAMLLHAITGTKQEVDKNICIASPLKKKLYLQDDDVLNYCAQMNVLLSYYKLKDNLRDDKNPIYLPILLIYRIKINKLLKKFSQKSYIIDKELKQLMDLEKKDERDIDVLSNIFGKIIQTVFTYELLDVSSKKAVGWLGFNLGKWIYVIDAFDDLEKDMKKKRFNPLIIDDMELEAIRERQRERVIEYLFNCLEEASMSYELLDIKQNKDILENIIYSGLYKKTLERCSKDEKSI
jgi:hypothetical protein